MLILGIGVIPRCTSIVTMLTVHQVRFGARPQRTLF